MTVGLTRRGDLLDGRWFLGIVFGLTAGYERFLFFNSGECGDGPHERKPTPPLAALTPPPPPPLGADWLSWRLVLAIQWVFPALTVIGLFMVTDSPVFQLKKGRTSQALATLTRLYPRETTERVRARLATIQHGVAIEQEAAASQRDVSVRDLFGNGVDRRRTMITIGTWIVFQAGGGWCGRGRPGLAGRADGDCGGPGPPSQAARSPRRDCTF
jgi:hypothetical protein